MRWRPMDSVISCLQDLIFRLQGNRNALLLIVGFTISKSHMLDKSNEELHSKVSDQ